MRVGVSCAESPRFQRIAEEAVQYLRNRRPDMSVRTDSEAFSSDKLILCGDDRFFLEELRKVDGQAETLLVGEGFLAETPPSDLSDAINSILRNQHGIELRHRLAVKSGSGELPPILNEVSLSARKGAGFLRYSLEVDGELLWRDGGDGLIISTPTGSTGYGLSAGGPIIMENADAIVAVPVCSATGQRPLVLPSKSVIRITGLESRWGCELILDGSFRNQVHSSGFSVRSSDKPIRLIRLGRTKYLRMFGKLRARRASIDMPTDAAPSAKYVFRLLSDQGAMTEKQLIVESGLPERTVRNALTFLVGNGFVERSSSLRDAREAIFSIHH